MTTHDLSNRTAVVTGAASGIGAATAVALARSGAKVVLLARRADRLAELAAGITAEGGQALPFAADVTRDFDTAPIRDAFGRVDMVVNAAGVMLVNPFTDSRTDEWARMLDTNLAGLLRVTDTFRPDLVEAAQEGPADLVNVSSIGAHLTLPTFAVYSATKAAVTHLSANLRTELGPLGVRVTNVEPGVVDTELSQHIDNPELVAQLPAVFAGVQPLSAEEVADAIGYITSLPRNVNLPQVVIQPTSQF
ncbi:SDR family oxidoreductase [Saccharothrix coeruleofusca]|uniref:Aldehyde dehydrogenase n=1 Tax=Saccharothrix coeruleofusca TaxID=33919 RepID=A0A918EFK6_9PSEU|nr:SDR family oxidoreductase [Saccharothrix coeruleofusca]MBP2341031.1 NADP-dependent 3-hydroxy acid dehydrogenase YdfG [Saccharothrix coeruleofusca]GGP61593.1 aldehyde dehydrogenase [Saccharothrix coeruleofusca]